MAYREFYQGQQQPVADYSPLERGIANLFQGMTDAYTAKKNATDKFQYVLDYGMSENDNKIIEEYTKSVTNSGKRELKERGDISPETMDMMVQGKRIVGDIKGQTDRYKQAKVDINQLAAQDKFYDWQTEEKDLDSAFFGADGDRDFRTRKEPLDKTISNLGKDPAKFKIVDYAHNYVSKLGEKQRENTTAAGASYQWSSPFVDPKTGQPMVTDSHAFEFLQSNPKAEANIAYSVETDIRKNTLPAIKQLAAKNDDRVAWAKGKSDDEILQEIMTGNQSSPYEKAVPFGQRVTEKAKNYLENAAKISKSIKAAPTKETDSDGPVKNKNIGHTTSFLSNKVGVEGVSDKVADAFRIGTVAGPGGILLNKQNNNRPIVIDGVSSKNAFNLRSGTDVNRSGAGKFNLTGYQLLPYRNNGTLMPISGNSVADLKQSIERLTPDQLKSMQPEMQIGLQGYSIDAATLGGDISTKSFSLNEQLGDAIDANDLEAQNKIRSQIQMLDQLRTMSSNPDIFDEDVINAAARSGIKQIRTDQVLKADRSDMDRVKAITDGLDLTNQNNWSPEMKELNDFYKAKWQSANSGATTLKPKVKAESKAKFPLATGKPKVVKQNGVEYVYNENTGSYE